MPKVFISYSWSNPDHERWVIELASSLVDCGIDVKLDKWDLRIGQDSIAFMESMVTDTTIDKVIIISDKIYSEKADGRLGGVGTETQIISKRIYEQIDQERFIAVIAEKDDHGKAYIPTFYHSRIYINLSQPDTYSQGLEELIRCIYGQPQHVKPKLGKKPEFLTKDSPANLGTSALANRAISALREGRSYAGAATEEYLSRLSENMERLRLIDSNEILFDELVISSIEGFTSQRNEYIQVITNAIRYGEPESTSHQLHRFLESLTKYKEPPADASGWRGHEFDNYLFILNELFLYTATLTLTLDRPQILVTLLNKPYYISSSRSEPYLTSHECFYKNQESLDFRNQRLNLGRKSISADITKETNSTSGVNFSALMQADFILFLHTQIHQSGLWWPKTLVYLNHFPRAFELFVRSESNDQFQTLKKLLGVQNKQDLTNSITNLTTNHNSRYWGFDYGFDIGKLANLENLDARP